MSALAQSAMTSYLDLPITAGTPVVAVRAVEAFLESVRTTPPSDRFLKAGRGWWKVSVSKQAWDQSRSQLVSLFEAANADPSLDLERAADDLLAQGRYVEAVTGYVAAASAAGKAVLPVRFRLVLEKALGLLSQFTLSSATPAQSTLVGKPFGATFDVKLTYGSGSGAPAVAQAPLRFNYQANLNGRPAVTGQTKQTDVGGLVAFELPVPEVATKDSLTVLIDVTAWLEALAAVPQTAKEAVTRFEKMSAERQLKIPYTVESGAKLIPMIVALADFDEKGSVQRRQETTSALIAALQKAGFATSGIPVNPTLLKSSSDNVVLAAWKFQGKTTGRAVYGTVNVVSVAASTSGFTAEVSGTLKVADLATSKPVYQMKTSRISSAADRASAVALAYREWALEAAITLETNLP